MPLHFTVISDTHYYSKRVGTTGKAYDLDNQKSQKLLADSGDVLRAAFAQIARDDRSDIVLLSGDITNNGEVVSHEEIVPLLRELQNAGKRVFAITASHDYDENYHYDGDEKRKAPKLNPDEAAALYEEFGPAQAIARHQHSYIAQLAPGYRLFALNDDNDGEGHSGFSKEHLAWIEQQVAEAQKAGDFCIPMTHHPLISPSPFYAIIGKNDMMGGHKKTRERLADAGLPFCFTGHNHIQDISYLFSKAGNVFYDLSTPALVGYPGTFRHAVADREQGTIEVTTERITEPLPFDLDERLNAQFFGMIRDVIAVAGKDIPRFAEMGRAFSIKPKMIFRYGWLIKPVAKWLGNLKIGTVVRWSAKESGLRPADYAAIAQDGVVEFIISLVMHLFGGDAPYTPDTPHYKITIGLLNILDSILRTLRVKFSVRSLVEPLLYNAGICDDHALLNLRATEAEVLALCPQFEETVKPSKKGLPIIIISALLLLCFWPLLLLVLGTGFLINWLRYHDKMD